MSVSANFITASKIKCRGVGFRGSGIVAAATNASIFTVDPAGTGGIQNVAFINFELDSANQTSAQPIIVKGGNYATSDYCNNVLVEDCYLRNLGQNDVGLLRIYSGRGSTDRGPVTHVTIKNTVFDTSIKYLVYVTGGEVERLRFSECKFINSNARCIAFNQTTKQVTP
jgi:hypothetical protein